MPIPQRIGDLYRYSPKVHYGETMLPHLLEKFALQAEERRKIERERKTLKKLGIDVPGERPEPTSMIGKLTRGITDVFRPVQPMGDIEKELYRAQIKQKYPSATDLLTTTLLSRELGGLRGGIGEIPEKPTAELPEGYEYQLAEDTVRGVPVRRWEVKKVTEGKPIYTEKLDRDLARAIRGEMSWDEVRTKFPTKTERIDKIRRQHMLLTRSPKFKEGRGLQAWRSPRIARLTPPTKRVIANIKSQADLDELLKNRGDYEDAGADVNAILEYFGKEKLE